LKSFCYDYWTQALPIYLGAGLRLSGGDARHLVAYCGVNIMLTLVTSGLAWFSVSINRAFAAASLIANTQYTFIGLTRSGARTPRPQGKNHHDRRDPVVCLALYC
jgi:hypothetical protein